jgi:Zn-dependent metalloprotease
MQVASVLALCLIWTVAAMAQPAPVDPEAVAGVIKTLQAPDNSEEPTLFQTGQGYVRFLGAPPEGFFASSLTGAKGADPAASAETFLKDNVGAFTPAPAATLTQSGMQEFNGKSFVRFSQQYGEVPVYGAGAVVQTDADGRIYNVMSDVLRDTAPIASGDLSLSPTVTADTAEQAAKVATANRYDDVVTAHLNRAHPPALEIYDPAVLGVDGNTRLVWRFGFNAVFPRILREVAIVDAHTGEVVATFTKVTNALDRDVRDSANTGLFPEDTARAEGDDATGIGDVDDAYDFLGDTYDFYLQEHNYDSFDNNGSTMIAVVRLPFFNAFWNGIYTAYGTGLAVDDVVAHEVTHGVTEFSSGLIYFGFSGAINESFSDIWGEFVDLTNGAGNDSEAVRWFLGEDIAIDGDGSGELEAAQGSKRANLSKQGDEDIPPTAIRYMKDPTVFNDPDRLGSPLLFNPNSVFDNGGVHINSGIGNKLAYLLTDGDSFNGETVQGMGISRVADLFFGTQFLLSPSADYNDLFLAMNASSIDQGFSFSERLNIAAAGRAVEIAPADATSEGLRGFRATPSMTLEGDPVIALTWSNPEASDFRNVTLVRSLGGFVTAPEDGVEIYTGTGEQFLDTNVVEGTTYYYTIIATYTENFPQVSFAQALAGGLPAPVLSEGFSNVGTSASPIDLSFTQLTFVPVGPASGDLGSPGRGVSYDRYEVTRNEVFNFPVPRDDVDGGAFRIPVTEDGSFGYGLGGVAFPYFGVQYTRVYVSSNGYISFLPVSSSNTLNFPSLEAHFAIPRISFLFSDLGLSIGGEVWGRTLQDRVVFTFENAPEYPSSFDDTVSAPNSVQVELFTNGQIRITYLELNVDTAFVGLSDGRGIPPQLSDFFPGVIDVERFSDFSEAPATPGQLYIEPVPVPEANGGDILTFDVEVIGAPGNDAPIEMFGTWDGPGAVPFAQIDDDTGRFNWEVPIDESGIFTFRVNVVQGAERTFQDVRIFIGATIQDPLALDLALSSDTAFEDPTEDRTVDVTRPLIASYSYFHPDANSDPLNFTEGDTILWWYRNGEIVPAYTNSMSVPAGATRAGDTWYFSVIPVTTSFIVGEETFSPVVTITALPQVTQVTPAFGLTSGGEKVTITGTRLGSPIRILFGGVEVAGFTTLGDTSIEVTTPLHGAGAVDIAIETPTGTGIYQSGFFYVNSIDEIPLADVNLDGNINATDVQLVVEAVLGLNKAVAKDIKADTNGDGEVNAADVQTVVNEALRR